MSYLLHPPLLDEAGVKAALGWYIEGLQKRSGLSIELSVSEDFGRLPSDMELLIFRVIQECLTNIHKHSASETAIIRLTRSSTNILLVVEDHGKGMSSEKLAQVRSHGAGVGLRGMSERLHHVQGELRLDSDRNGTRVSVVIPLPHDTTPVVTDCSSHQLSSALD